jgi:hypothetical protein
LHDGMRTRDVLPRLGDLVVTTLGAHAVFVRICATVGEFPGECEADRAEVALTDRAACACSRPAVECATPYPVETWGPLAAQASLNSTAI